MSPDERRALTERLRGGRAAREMPFGPGTLTRVIAVTSGKGGVGKSTVTANLAVALAARGLSVGLVDADVHGFSIPALLGLVDADGARAAADAHRRPHAPARRVRREGDLDRHVPAPDAAATRRSSAVAWRGPMLHRTVQQFLTDVYFGDLDVLLLDMPPGTGDVAISVGQLLPNADVLVVTTPQAAASDIAVRSGLVARQTGQRVVGVVENMAAMTLPDGSTLELFGSGGGAAVAAALSDDARRRAAAGLDPAQPGAARGRGCRHPGRRRPPRRCRVRRHRATSPPRIAVDAARARRAGRCRSARAEPDRRGVRWLRRRTAAPRPGRTARATRAGGVVAGDRGARPARRRRGHGRIVEQRLADDAPRVVLARIEGAPVEVFEVLAHLVLHARPRGRQPRRGRASWRSREPPRSGAAARGRRRRLR